MPAEDQRQIGPRRGEVGRDLERAPKQILGILHPPDPRRQLGQHADRADVERVFLEVRLQQPLGDVEPVVVAAPPPPRSGAGASGLMPVGSVPTRVS